MKKTAFSLGKRLLAISVCLLLVALTACTPTPPTTSPTVTPPPSGNTTVPPTGNTTAPPSKVVVVPPKVTGIPKIIMGKLIAAPKDGFEATSNAVYVQLDLTNVNLVNPKATNVEGEAHVNFYVDYTPSIEPGKTTALPSPIPAKAKIYVGGSAIAQNLGYQWKGLSNGNHTLAAEVVQNDDTPFNPPIWGLVNVKVNYTAPPASSPAAK